MNPTHSITLYRCREGHIISDPEPAPGHGDGPPYHCPYPCMADVTSVAEYERTTAPRRMTVANR